MKLPIITLENKSAGDIELLDTVFGVPVRVDLMNRAVHWQRNKARQGTHKTKDVSEVSGTGKKPFKQKGTGSARAANRRATQHRGGQIVFGPVVRSHATDLPKKIRLAALRSALSCKVAEGKVIILDDVKAKTHKTKEMAATFTKLQLASALIMFAGELDTNFGRGLSNIPRMDVLPANAANVLDILRHDHLVLTQGAAQALEERLK